jgi:signal transduction histidine kinase
MSPILRKLRPWLEPAVGIVFFVLWTVAEIGRYQQFGLSPLLGLLALAAAIALSRVKPVAALVLVGMLLLLQALAVVPPPLSTSWPVYFGAVVVVFVVACYAPVRVARVALALGLPFALAFGYSSQLGDVWLGMDRIPGYTAALLPVTVVSLCVYAGGWAAGYALRTNLAALRAQLQLRSTAAQLDATEMELQMVHERDRIAREVHDVLAHSLAVVIAQADGARFIRDTKPAQTEQRTDDALFAISDAARAALIDVRTLVEGLREDQGEQPQPGLDEIPVLLAQLGRAGMTIDARHFGDAKAMTPAQQLAVYRIVQESLTNALRHADRAAATRLSFDWRGPGLAVSVASVGAASVGAASVGAATQASAPHGNGIRGMKDRARLAGGWLTAGASDTDDEFVVTLFVPTGIETSATEAAA